MQEITPYEYRIRKAVEQWLKRALLAEPEFLQVVSWGNSEWGKRNCPQVDENLVCNFMEYCAGIYDLHDLLAQALIDVINKDIRYETVAVWNKAYSSSDIDVAGSS